MRASLVARLSIVVCLGGLLACDSPAKKAKPVVEERCDASSTERCGTEPETDAGDELDSGNTPAKKLRLRGRVFDAQSGRALDEVSLQTSAGEQAVSDRKGSFELELGAEVDQLAASRSKYAPSRKSAPREGGYMELFLKEVDVDVEFRGDEGKRVSLDSGATLDIPANAVRDRNGDPVAGLVTLELSGVDGRDRMQASALPGEGVARRKDDTQGRVAIESALDIRIRSGSGEELSVDPAADVVAEFPVREADAPENRSVYSFDEQTSRWVEEGTARRTLNDRGERVYRADIEHLSWWSYADFFSALTCVRTCVVDGDGAAIEGAQVWLVGASHPGVASLYTDGTGCGASDVIASAELVVVAQYEGAISGVQSVVASSEERSVTDGAEGCQDLGTLTLGEPSDTGCASGFEDCEGQCVDFATDGSNCGACGAACEGAPQRAPICIARECRCPVGQASCGFGATAACVWADRDREHCGGCNKACLDTEECVDGACEVVSCDQPDLRCGPDCVDVTTNDSTCGSCDVACAQGSSCVDSTCEGSVVPMDDAGVLDGSVSTPDATVFIPDAGTPISDAAVTCGAPFAYLVPSLRCDDNAYSCLQATIGASLGDAGASLNLTQSFGCAESSVLPGSGVDEFGATYDCESCMRSWSLGQCAVDFGCRGQMDSVYCCAETFGCTSWACINANCPTQVAALDQCVPATCHTTLLGSPCFDQSDAGIGDTDRDGVADSTDNCTDVPNAEQLDGDGDGFGSACDVCPLVFDAGQADGDNDGVGNACDICVTVADAQQANNAACRDTDGDGIELSIDSCPLVFNGGADNDLDGIDDVCDQDANVACEALVDLGCPACSSPAPEQCTLVAAHTPVDEDCDGVADDGCALRGVRGETCVQPREILASPIAYQFDLAAASDDILEAGCSTAVTDAGVPSLGDLTYAFVVSGTNPTISITMQAASSVEWQITQADCSTPANGQFACLAGNAPFASGVVASGWYILKIQGPPSEVGQFVLGLSNDDI